MFPMKFTRFTFIRKRNERSSLHVAKNCVWLNNHLNNFFLYYENYLPINNNQDL